MTLAEFSRLLRVHDWWCAYSDDPRVEREGRQAFDRIEAIARSHPEHMALYRAWINHAYYGGPEPAKLEVVE